MHHHSQRIRQRVHVIPETHRADHDESNQEWQVFNHEPFTLNHKPEVPHQHRDDKYHSATPEHDGAMTRPLVGLVNDVAPVCNLKVQQLRCQQQHCDNNVCPNHILYLFFSVLPISTASGTVSLRATKPSAPRTERPPARACAHSVIPNVL